MVVLACLTDPRVVNKILGHLGLPSTAPALGPARSFGQLELFEDQEVDHQGSLSRSDPRGPNGGSRSSRGPPLQGDGQDWVVELDESQDL